MKTTTKIFALSLALVTYLQTQKMVAQSPTWQWAKSAGSTGSEAAMGTALDASGNLYVIGWYTSINLTFGSITLTNPGVGTGDIFLVKYDATGNVLWAKTFGGTEGDIGNGIAVDASGNIYITGWYASPTINFGTTTLTNAGSASSDVFIVKLNPSGNEIWAKSVGGSATDRGYGITLDASGNVFTTGGFSSATINFGSGNLTNAGATNDFFITKHDSNGNNLWAKNAGGTNADVGYSAATDSLGNVYATGVFSSSSINFGLGALNNSTSGTQDIFVVKYNGSGTAVWSTRAGGSLDDTGNGIAVKKNSVFVTGGFSSASITFAATSLNNNTTGTSDVFLTKFDLNGNMIWANRYGDADSEAGNCVSTNAGGSAFVTGFYISNSINFGSFSFTNPSPGYRDLFVTAHGPNGNVAWAATALGGSYDEVGNSIAVNNNGTEIYVGGMFNSPSVSFGANSIFKGCGDDVFVAKLLGSSSVGFKEEFIKNQLTVYPNPNEGKFTVNGDGQIILYNSLGEILLTENLNSVNYFDFSSQAKGVYLYRVISEKKAVHTGRIIVN
ncbi:MAG: SBBP repeat-containing protein [Bacteroidota bacterium]|nr:SBBP repeat-containing protein [Bacteroidota bacterium]MDP3147042.1 SBBP repeat-containing protein [Bacteroidota bacterium]